MLFDSHRQHVIWLRSPDVFWGARSKPEVVRSKSKHWELAYWNAAASSTVKAMSRQQRAINWIVAIPRV